MEATDDVLPFGDASSLDETAGEDAGSFLDAAVGGDAADAADAADAMTPFNGGGPFDCNGCICDGTLDYCYFAGGGPPHPSAPIADAGAPDALPACDVDASPWCRPIPIECLPKPTCDCLSQPESPVCTCAVDPSGDGFHVECVFP